MIVQKKEQWLPSEMTATENAYINPEADNAIIHVDPFRDEPLTIANDALLV